MILLAGTAMAGTEEMEMRLGNIIQRKQLLTKRSALLEDLKNIDANIEVLATTTTTTLVEDTTPPTTDTTVTPPTTDTTVTPPAADTTPPADEAEEGSKKGLFIGLGVGALVAAAGAAWWCNRSKDSEAEGGASDDLYSKFITAELSA